MADAGLPGLQVKERDRCCGQVGLTRALAPGPLQACQRGHSQHLEHLLFYGAEPGAQNASGNTALHICALYNKVCSPPDSRLPAPPVPPAPLFHCFKPPRLLGPWDSPGKNTGVGCYFLLHELTYLQTK